MTLNALIEEVMAAAAVNESRSYAVGFVEGLEARELLSRRAPLLARMLGIAVDALVLVEQRLPSPEEIPAMLNHKVLLKHALSRLDEMAGDAQA